MSYTLASSEEITRWLDITFPKSQCGSESIMDVVQSILDTAGIVYTWQEEDDFYVTAELHRGDIVEPISYRVLQLPDDVHISFKYDPNELHEGALHRLVRRACGQVLGEA